MAPDELLTLEAVHGVAARHCPHVISGSLNVKAALERLEGLFEVTLESVPPLDTQA